MTDRLCANPRRSFRARLALLPLACLAIAGTPARVLAHAVETNYDFSAGFSNQLELQSVFSTGDPMAEATVRVYAPGNPDEPWMEGTTDAEGRFVLAPDLAVEGEWTVEILQEGHGDILAVPVTQQGVDTQNITQIDSRDVHYAGAVSTPWAAAGFAAVGTAGAIAAFRRERRAAR